MVLKDEFQIPHCGKLSRIDRRHCDRLCKPRRERHDFIWIGYTWLCTKCLRRTNSPSTLLATQSCSRSSTLCKIINHDLGHQLVLSTYGVGKFIVHCSNCWAYAESAPKLLGLPCTGQPIGEGKRTTFCPVTRDRILSRRHPVTMHNLSAPISLRNFSL